MKKVYFYLFIAVTTLGLFSCQSGNKEENDVIKIGAILPLEGKYADVGNSVKAGLVLGEQKLKQDNKKTDFALLIENASSTQSGSEASLAVNAYNKLVNVDKAKVILTTTSAICLALKPLAVKDSVLLFCIASHPEITNNNNGLIFRPCNTSFEECKAISEDIKSKYDTQKEKIYVLFHNSEFGLAFKKQLKEDLGSCVIGDAAYDDNNNSFKDIITKVKEQKPTIVVAVGFTPSLGSIVKTIRELGMKETIYANIGFSSPSALKFAGETANGVKYVNYNFPKNTEYFKSIQQQAETQLKTGFGPMSYLSFFSINAIINAAQTKNTNSSKDIATYLHTLKTMSVNGIEMQMQENGNILPNLYIEEYKMPIIK